MEKKFDAVVIGAGNGGLIAATTLAKQNQKVLLLEKHNLPGGFATSFVRGRFEFDPSLHELCDLGNKNNQGFVYKLFQELDIKVDWKPVPEAFRLITKMNDFRYDLTFPFGLVEFAQRCEKYVPNSYDSVIKFLKICHELKKAITYIEEVRGKPDTKFLKKHFPNFLTTAPYTLKEVLDQLKVPLLTQNFIEAYWSYLGVPSSRVSFHIYAIMFYEYVAFGAYIPANRSHEISENILTRFKALGGEVWFNTAAEEILVENKRVVGVRTQHGVIKTNYVISNVSPHIVYGQLIRPTDIPEYDRKLVNTRKPGVQGFSVYLGLDISVQDLGLDCYSYFVSKDLFSEKQFNRMKTLNNTEDYIVVALNNAHKHASEPDTCILSFTTLFMDAWKNVTEKEYFKLKNELATKIIKHFENLMKINIRDHIEEVEIATPITFARYTGAINGAIYGYDITPFDSTFSRSASMDRDVGIQGLRFCGGNSYRGHGYSTTYLSGKTMAMKTFSEMLLDPELTAERELRKKLADEKLMSEQKARSLKQKALTEKQIAENEKQRLQQIKNAEESRLKAAAEHAKALAEAEREKLLAKENAINIANKIQENKQKSKNLDDIRQRLYLDTKHKIKYLDKQIMWTERDLAAGKIDEAQARDLIKGFKDEKGSLELSALVPLKSRGDQKAQIADADHQSFKSSRAFAKHQRRLEKQQMNIEQLRQRRLYIEDSILQEDQAAANALVVKKQGQDAKDLTDREKERLEYLRLKQQRKIAKQNAKAEKRRLKQEQKETARREALTPEAAAALTERQNMRAEKLKMKQARADAKLKLVEARHKANIEKLINRLREVESAIENAHITDINASAVKVALEQAKHADPSAPAPEVRDMSTFSKEELRAEKIRIKEERLLNKQAAKEERRRLKLEKKEAKQAARLAAAEMRGYINVPNEEIAPELKTGSDDEFVKISRAEIREEIRRMKTERKLAKQLAKQEKRRLMIEARENARFGQEAQKQGVEAEKLLADTAISEANAKAAATVAASAAAAAASSDFNAPVPIKNTYGKQFRHEEVQPLNVTFENKKYDDLAETLVDERKLAKQERKAERILAKQERKLAKQAAKQERMLLREQAHQSKMIAVEADEIADFKRTKPIGYSGMDELIVSQQQRPTAAARTTEMIIQQQMPQEVDPIAASLFKFNKFRRFGKEKNIYEFSDKIERKIDKYLHKTYNRHTKLLELEQIEAKKIASVEMLRDSLITNKRLLKLAIISENEKLKAEEAAAAEAALPQKIKAIKPAKPAKKAKPVKAEKPAKVAKPTKPIKKAKPVKVEKPAKVAKPAKPVKAEKPAKVSKLVKKLTPVKKAATVAKKPDVKPQPTPKVVVKKPADKKAKLIKYTFEHAKTVEDKIKSLKMKPSTAKSTKVKTIKVAKPLPEPIAKKKVNRR